MKEGNNDRYGSAGVEFLAGNPLEGKKILFLGSSVTFGSASMEDGIPEYFARRLGCDITKEAVSGTTLVDKDKESYVSRLLDNVSVDEKYSLVVCQLSTNDATLGLPMGELGSYDKNTIVGAMEFIIKYCRENWNCPIMFYTGSRYDSLAYKQMVEQLYKIKEMHNIGIIDLWSDDEFNNISDEQREFYMNDPIHPVKAGYMLWWCPEMEKQLLEYYSQVVIK